MNKNEAEKKAMELTAIDIFIELYNRNNNISLRMLRQQEKPDALLEDIRQNRTGLEVTHLFYDTEEARLMLSRSELTKPGAEVLDTFINVINDRIRNKEEKFKGYSHEHPCMLLIRNVSLLFGMSDVLGKKHKLVLPRGQFTDVWLLSRDFTPDWLLINLYEIEG
ncbi:MULTISPECIES: hypothetical protein [unclassified Paenibacillus]|uniref:hypothetical protein n=1 Tax=unclassified Paenibacillus TaxID=185978 RepID=UPI00278B429E|nr:MULTISPECIES: hypothetical protein [unclassified Paenibacillus]MDQ0903764.1 hypothetical protein [Paenibacillus sp. V4I7]MDQ0917762.1 hypothetical protein [Paenibacillus sp. V4I5]